MITSCEAFENFPPGLPGRALYARRQAAGRRERPRTAPSRAGAGSIPLALGWMAKRPVPHEVTDALAAPALDPARGPARRDQVPCAAEKGDMLAAAERLRSFDRPSLVAWAAEDRVMPPSTEAARRLRRRAADRDSRQLHPHPRRPARRAGPRDPRVHPRHALSFPVVGMLRLLVSWLAVPVIILRLLGCGAAESACARMSADAPLRPGFRHSAAGGRVAVMRLVVQPACDAFRGVACHRLRRRWREL